MREITKKELAELLEKKNDLDFVTYAITPFHMLCVKALLEKIHDVYGRRIKGIILIGKHEAAGYMLTSWEKEDWVDAEIYRINMAYRTENPAKKKVSYKEKKMIIATPMDPWAFLGIYCKENTTYIPICITLDDGIGSYLSVRELFFHYIESSGSLRISIKRIIGPVVSRIILTVKGIKYSHFGIFAKKNFMNEETCEYYRKTLTKETSDENQLFEGKSLLYLGSWYEDECDLINKEKVAKELMGKYSNSGYDIYIKGHPRYPLVLLERDFPVTTITSTESIENILGKSVKKPMIVVTWMSTAIFTLAGLWKIETIVLVDKYDKKYYSLIKENVEKFAKVTMVDAYTGKVVYESK